jgi:hypothetical protein
MSIGQAGNTPLQSLAIAAPGSRVVRWPRKAWLGSRDAGMWCESPPIRDLCEKKGPMHQGDRPKSREETPKKGCETSLSHERGYGSAALLNQEALRQNFAQKVKFCTGGGARTFKAI